jgi:hypothetical protein
VTDLDRAAEENSAEQQGCMLRWRSTMKADHVLATFALMLLVKNEKDTLALLDRATRDLAIPMPTAPEVNQLYQDAFCLQMAGQDNKGASRDKSAASTSGLN